LSEDITESVGTETDNLRGGLTKIKLFSDLPSESVHKLEKMCSWRQFAANDVVVDRTDGSRKVFFVAEGSVRVMNYIGENREVTLAEMKSGDHFGELAAIGPRERTARVIAIEKTIVGAMARDRFLDMLLEFPQVSLRLLHELAYIISSMNERVATLSIAKPRQRIYLELMRLAVPDPRGGGAWLIEPVPQHNEIAAWAGVEEVEVAQAIGTLAREKIIERKNRTLIIHDRAKIHEMAAM